MFDIHRVQLDWGGRKLTLETGRMARQADGAVLATYGDTSVLATVVAAKQPQGRHRLPAADRQLPGKILRRRPHSRRLFQARRPSDREGDADLAADRPADPAAVRRRLALRYAGHHHHAVARSRKRSGHRGDGRGLRRADAFGRAVHGPDRRRPRRLHQQRVRAQSADRRDGRERARSRRRRHAGRGADGRIGGQGAHRGDHARRRDVRPPAFPAGDRRHHPAGGEGGQGAARAHPGRQCGAREGNARAGRAGAARRLCDPGQDGAPQGGRRRQGHAYIGHFSPQGAESAKYPTLQVAGVFKELEAQDRTLEHPRHRHAHRRPRREDRTPDRVRGRRAAAHARLGAVHPRRDAGAGGGDARHRRGRAVRRRAAGHLQGDVSCCTTISRRSRSARPAASAPPAGARSVTASSPGALSIRCCRRTRVSLHDPRRLRDHRVERLVLDGDGLRHLAGADGCRRAAEAADRGHRHGPDPGGQALRRPLRHSRRRGSSRRHGLQGRRHRARRYLAADGHQDLRHHRGDHAHRARPGEGRPHAHPRRDGQGDHPRTAPSSASTRRASRCSRSRSTRSARSSARAAR